MVAIKLVYFDLRGRAEASRLALTIGDIEFEDHRVSFDEFPKVKDVAPYRALPYMELDGELISAQSNSILRYCGTLVGLYPAKDPVACLKVDDVLDTLEDIGRCFFRYRGKDEAKILEERTKFVKEDVPRYFGGLNKMLAKYGDGPWAVGGAITIADLAIYAQVVNLLCGIGIIDHIPTDILDAYPRIMASYSAVLEHPKVVAWLEEHPVATPQK